MTKKNLVLFSVLILLVSNIYCVLASDVTRVFEATSIAPGQIIDIDLIVDVTGADTMYAFEEQVPAGWDILDNGGLVNSTEFPNTLRHAETAAVDVTWTYTVRAPVTPNTYQFDGTYEFEFDTQNYTILGETDVTVSSCTITNAYWNQTLANDLDLVELILQGTGCDGEWVNFTIRDYDDWLEGFGDDDVSNNPTDVQFVGGTARGYWVSDYQPDGIAGVSDPPEYFFIATLVNDVSESMSSGTGDSVTLDVLEINPQSRVVRRFNQTSVDQGDYLEVTVDVRIWEGESFYVIEEFVPAGWAVADYGTGGPGTDPLRLAWYDHNTTETGVIHNVTHTYVVQALAAPGTYYFNGSYQFEGYSENISTMGLEAVDIVGSSCSNTGENNWDVVGESDCNQCDHEGDDDGDQPGWSAPITDFCDSDCGIVSTTVQQANYEASETSCSDGIDNDCDGDIDSLDSDCPVGIDLVAYYDFEEGSGTTATDNSAYGNNGVISGASYVTGRLGNYALDFNGVDSYVNLGSSASLDGLTSDYTVCAWIYPRSYGDLNYGRIFGKGTNQGFQFMVNNEPSAPNTTWLVHNPNGVRDNNANANFNSVSLNTWQHVCLVHDDSADSITFYHDSSDVTLDGNIDDVVDHSANDAYIGIREDMTRAFDGLIDEVRVYNGALSSSEVLDLYNQGNDLLAYYDFEVIAGTNVADQSTFGNDGTLIGGMSYTTGRVGTYALLFDGVDDYVDLGSADFDYPEVSVSAWVRVDSAHEGRIVLGNAADTNYWVLGVDEDAGEMRFVAANGPAGADDLETTVPYNIREWYHVVMTSNPLNLYVNAIDVADRNRDESYTRDGNAKIGARSPTAMNFNGSIDDVKIYRKTLSFPEIQDLYADGSGCNADVDFDGDVDDVDISLVGEEIILGRNYLSRNPCGRLNPCEGDFDCDHDVGSSEYVIVRNQNQSTGCTQISCDYACDFDGDGYDVDNATCITSTYADCDDANPFINPGVLGPHCSCPSNPQSSETECADGYDNDCDGDIDGLDADCGVFDYDLNDDFVVDITDLIMAAMEWGSTGCNAGNLYCNGADVNMNGEVFIDDLSGIGLHFS